MKNFLKIKENALKYLGYHQQIIDEKLNCLIDECIEEIDQMSSFKATYRKFPLSFHPLRIDELNLNLDYPDLNQLFKNCHEIVLISCTLGIQIDRKEHYYSHIDMTKATVLDAVASSYLETKCDEYENEQFIGKRTYRFCPGYGNVPIELNKELARIMESYKKIGLTVQKSNILLPQKSMIGLIGLGDNQRKKTCLNCFHIKDCNFRKRGQTCYAKD